MVAVQNLMQGSLIVTGVKQDVKPTSYFKKKVRHYINEQGIGHQHAILVEDDVDSRWLDHLPRVDADTIKAIKLPRDGGGTGPRAETPYDYYTIDDKGVVHSDTALTVPLPKGKTMVYVSPQDYKETYRKQGTNPSSIMAKLGKDYVLVVTGKNRFEKFLRTHSAMPLRIVFQSKIDAFAASATNAEFVIGKLDYGQQEFLKKVPFKQIKDKELRDLAELVQSKGMADNYNKAEQLHLYARRCSLHLNLPARKDADTSVVDRYPLIDTVGSRQMDHMIIYINAVWEQTNGK
jgi:hypothetical protein